MRARLVALVVAVAVSALASCGDDGDATAVPPGESAVASTTTTTRAPDTSAPPTSQPPAGAVGGVERLRVEVLERLAHDPGSFTQGLELDGDTLYESAGLYGESSVRVVDPARGEVRHRVDLDDQYFGEGLTKIDDTLVVLTWREGTAFVLDATTLEERARHRYDGEGWGICDDGRRLVMSDGTSTLRFRDRTSFAEVSHVDVTLDGRPVVNLNELECVGDDVYANVWQTDTLVRIDPATGRVTATIDASGLLDEAERAGADVLNGIAYDASTDTFLLTGKHWPALFRVRFVPAS
ncbi:MAG TPA: glutaminyl-peptide cyclotransferase [Acidimicrobiales bacterium]